MKKLLSLTLLFLLTFNCSSNDDDQEPNLQQQQPQQTTNQSHIVEFQTIVLQNWVSVLLDTTITLPDNTQTTINSVYDYTTNKVSVTIPENAVSFELDFYIEDSSEVNMRFFGSENNSTVFEETISQLNYNYQYSFN